MDLAAIERLEAAGDTVTLATALRNVIAVTDDATEAAMEEALQRQEYVPVVLHKDAIYRALDTALRGEPYEPDGGLVFEEDELPEPDPEDDPNARPLARALKHADSEWEMFQNSISAEQDPDVDYHLFVAREALRYLADDTDAQQRPIDLRGACVRQETPDDER